MFKLLLSSTKLFQWRPRIAKYSEILNEDGRIARKNFHLGWVGSVCSCSTGFIVDLCILIV